MAALDYEPSAVYLFFDRNSRDSWIRARGEGGRPVSPDRVWVLSEAGDIRVAAANLFDLLHQLDRLAVSRIHAEKVPSGGLGLAINDRLLKASAAKNSEDHL
jgi:L-threonylcarbamoyladenylate synthase